MAEVWKAKVKGPAGFEKVLAIKRILPNHLTEQDYVELFIHEAKLVAQLQHPNIVQVFDFGYVEPKEAWEQENEYYMAMEYVAGQNVRAVTRALKASGRTWPVELALFITMETAKALAYAHRGPDGSGKAAVIHRDISPHNVLVSYHGRVKVTDFGIARVSNVLPRTADGIRRGKIAYMSPEQIDLHPLDGRTDIFSLGAVLYELLTNEKLFAGTDKAAIANKIRFFDFEALEHLDEIPGDIRYVLKHALHVDPEERYQDARDMEAELRSILGTTGEQEAPIALSSLVRELFETDYERENRHDDFDVEAATRVTPLAEVGEESGSQGATLLSSAANVHVEPDDLANRETVVGKPPVEPAEEKSSPRAEVPPAVTGEPPESSHDLRRSLMVVGGSVLLVVLGILLARTIPGLLKPSATPQPTKVAVTRIPTATPVATRSTPRSTPTPRPTATPRPVRTVARTPRPTPVSTPVVSGKGYLSVAARPWAEVWVDGKRVTPETPLRRLKLSAGDHVVEARHPQMGRVSKRIRVSRGEHVRLFVDVRKSEIREQ